MEAKHRWRVLILLLVFSSLAVAAFMLWKYGTGWMPGCLFRRWTGIECPGCGMTRGTYALFQGRIGEAFAYNPVGMVLFPIAAVAVGIQALGWATGKTMPFEIKSGRWGATLFAVLVIGWWIVRNIW